MDDNEPFVIESRNIAVRRVWTAALRGVAMGVLRWCGYAILFAFGVILLLLAQEELHWGAWQHNQLLLLLLLFSSIATRVVETPFLATKSWGRAGRAEVYGDEIRLTTGSKTRRIPRTKILSGFVGHRDGPFAVLRMRWQTIAIRVGSTEEAEELLRRIRLGPESRVLSTHLVSSSVEARVEESGAGAWLRDSKTHAPKIALAALALLLNWRSGIGGVSVGPALLITCFLLFDALASFDLVTTKIDVGADGITVRRPWRRTFVSARDIESATRSGARLFVSLRSGTKLSMKAQNESTAEAILERVRAVLELAGPGRTAAEERGVLARRGRPVPEWLRSVRGLAEKDSGYRSGWLDGRDLVTVVGNAKADAEERIAAAIALSDAEPEVRGRVRIALDACADEPARIAIEKALDGEIEAAEIEAALEQRKAQEAG
ncbi:MAG: hypothetical protein U0441_31250 [Polyangiaceae bacterium]